MSVSYRSDRLCPVTDLLEWSLIGANVPRRVRRETEHAGYADAERRSRR
jgi:hypothetical protein